MDYPQEMIVKMITDLKKEKKVSAKEIEILLDYSNGMIGKIKSGRTKLPDEKIGILSKFYFDKMNEGKQIGYMKILSDGTVEMGVIDKLNNKIAEQIDKEEENQNKAIKDALINPPTTTRGIDKLTQPYASNDSTKPLRSNYPNGMEYSIALAEWKEKNETK